MKLYIFDLGFGAYEMWGSFTVLATSEDDAWKQIVKGYGDASGDTFEADRSQYSVTAFPLNEKVIFAHWSAG